MIPYADFNLLKFPDRDQAMEKIKDLTLLSDIFPTGYHGAVTAGVGPGSIVYIAGGGPVGLACAAGSQLLGAACVIVGDMIPARLKQAKKFGCEVVDLTKDATLGEQIEQIVGVPEVDCGVDCVGFEARGHGHDSGVERPATVLNALMEVTTAGGGIGIPGLYVTGDPGGVDANAKIGNLGIRIGLGWAKSHHFMTGQCPVMKYHRQLMQAILYGKTQPAKAVNVTIISLDQAAQGYKDFDKGAAKKFVIDPHKMVKAA
jgi:glutathione-independent formaldehyde dehydrogenase